VQGSLEIKYALGKQLLTCFGTRALSYENSGLGNARGMVWSLANERLAFPAPDRCIIVSVALIQAPADEGL
jgi:hypothetical protein